MTSEEEEARKAVLRKQLLSDLDYFSLARDFSDGSEPAETDTMNDFGFKPGALDHIIRGWLNLVYFEPKGEYLQAGKLKTDTLFTELVKWVWKAEGLK